MSRKSQRLQTFLGRFGRYLIEYVSEHNSEANDKLIYNRFCRAIRGAAVDHYKQWKLTSPKLWNLFQTKILRCLRGKYKSTTAERVKRFLHTDTPNSSRDFHDQHHTGQRKFMLAKKADSTYSNPKRRRGTHN